VEKTDPLPASISEPVLTEKDKSDVSE